jgi:hypothetical protein
MGTICLIQGVPCRVPWARSCRRSMRRGRVVMRVRRPLCRIFCCILREKVVVSGVLGTGIHRNNHSKPAEYSSTTSMSHITSHGC